MEFRVEVSGMTAGMTTKAWMKEDIKDVFLESHGGWAIGGSWAWRNTTTVPVVFRPVVPGAAVLGVSIFEDSKVVDRVAFLMEIGNYAQDGGSIYKSWLTPNTSLAVKVEGPFRGTDVRGMLANRVGVGDPVSNVPDLIWQFTGDPFYWAAGMLAKSGIPNRGVNPKEMGPLINERPVETVPTSPDSQLSTVKFDVRDYVINKNGKKVALPKDVRLAYDINGIALLAYKDKDGTPSVGLADVLLTSKEPLTPKLIDWIKEQSREYQVLAESLKIIALAKTQEQKGENMQ